MRNGQKKALINNYRKILMNKIFLQFPYVDYRGFKDKFRIIYLKTYINYWGFKGKFIGLFFYLL